MVTIYKNPNATDDIVDALFFGAHPDDVELAAGGTVAKLTAEGKKVAVCDLTGGEMGTRGSIFIREKEANAAAEILGLQYRINLGMPDGYLVQTDENVLKVIKVLRRFRPKIVVMNQPIERHPDHESAHRIIRTAMFKSGLQKIETQFNGESQERFRIRKMFCYMQSYEYEGKPSFYVDVSDSFETKMKSIRAYSSQVYVAGESAPDEPQTRLSRPEFLEEIESRAIYFGTLIGCRYGESFSAVEPLGIWSLSQLM